MVRAKFKVTEKTQLEAGFRVRLCAVYGTGDSENAKFFKYTPNASIDMSVMSETAAAQFEVGKEYYVDFTPAFVPEEQKCEATTPCERGDC